MSNEIKKRTVEEIKTFLTQLQREFNIKLADDLPNCFTDEQLGQLDQSDPEVCFSQMTDILEESRYFDIEITYYSNAIEYLSENDPSLRDSLELAAVFGYPPQDLNSETLASLLASEEARESCYGLRDEVVDFFTLENN